MGCVKCVLNYSNRKDFFIAKGQFYALSTTIPMQLQDTFSLGENCTQELQSLSLLLPQTDINVWSQDAVEKVLLNLNMCLYLLL